MADPNGGGGGGKRGNCPPPPPDSHTFLLSGDSWKYGVFNSQFNRAPPPPPNEKEEIAGLLRRPDMFGRSRMWRDPMRNKLGHRKESLKGGRSKWDFLKRLFLHYLLVAP